MKHIHVYISWFTIVTSFLLVMTILYWAVFDGVYVNRVTNVDQVDFRTDKTVYHIGDEVSVTADGFCKFRPASANVFINLVDTVYYPYEVKHRSIDVGCPVFVPEKEFASFVMLPKNITGKYHLSGYFLYDINPIRSGENGIRVSFTSNDFTIIQ